MKAQNLEEAWKQQESQGVVPYGWLQWKGTDACMDFYCECGYHSHFDAGFMYVIQCPVCDRKYSLSAYIQVTEIIESDKEPVTAQIQENDKDEIEYLRRMVMGNPQ